MKMNKKGFTLIEMLVVIAIIAVLVAIVVPTVSSSTTKAKAATDAANLRSITAEAMVYALENKIDLPGHVAELNTVFKLDLKSDSENTEQAVTFTCTSTGDLVATCNGYTVASLAAIAEGN